MFKFQDTTCEDPYGECPDVTTEEPVVEEATEPVVPMLMTAFIAVPLLDLTAGIYNYVHFSGTAYSQDFTFVEIVEVLHGLVGLGAWVTGNVMGSPLAFINIYSKAVIACELAMIYLNYNSQGSTIAGTESGLVQYALHFIALSVAGAAMMPIGAYVADATAWDEAHTTDETVVTDETAVTDTNYDTAL